MISDAFLKERFPPGYMRQIPHNDIEWEGVSRAALGLWEFKRFTVLVDNGNALSSLYQLEPRIRSLIIQLDGVDTVVVGAGHNPDILSHPAIAPFVKDLKKARPKIRIVTQQYAIVG